MDKICRTDHVRNEEVLQRVKEKRNILYCVRNVVAHGDVREGKLANGVGSQYSHTTSGRSVSSIINADAHTSSASSQLN